MFVYEVVFCFVFFTWRKRSWNAILVIGANVSTLSLNLGTFQTPLVTTQAKQQQQFHKE